jgi:signal peptidase I
VRAVSWLAIGVTAVAAAAGAVLLLRRRFAVVTVVGPSMWPAFTAGDRVLVHRARLAKLRRGQVIVVEHPSLAGRRQPGTSRRVSGEAWMIKRVAALPGDPALSDHLPADVVKASARVPVGKLVVLGDNAAVSHDSRQLGYFASDQLLGIVLRPMNSQ